MSFGLTDTDLKYIISLLKEFPQIKEALIFGSRAKENFKPGSDVDLAIKGEKVTRRIVSQLSFELNEESPLPYFFDILHYEKITEPKLIEHIDRVGIVVFWPKA